MQCGSSKAAAFTRELESSAAHEGSSLCKNDLSLKAEAKRSSARFSCLPRAWLVWSSVRASDVGQRTGRGSLCEGDGAARLRGPRL